MCVDLHLLDNVLPAYDMNRKVIAPTFYANKLRGAMVMIVFHLIHWAIAKKGSGGKSRQTSDTYSTEIKCICVVAPLHNVGSHSLLKKQKLPSNVAPPSSLTKRVKA